MRGGSSESGITVGELKESCKDIAVRDYGELFTFSSTQFFTTCQPLEFLGAMTIYLTNNSIEYRISSDKLKIKFVQAIGTTNDLSTQNQTQGAAASESNQSDIEVHCEILKANHD